MRQPDRWVTAAQVAEHVAEHRKGNAPDVHLLATVLQHAASCGFLEQSTRVVTEGRLTGHVLHFRIPDSPVVAALDVAIAVQRVQDAGSRTGRAWVSARCIAATTGWRRSTAVLVAALEAAVMLDLLESKRDVARSTEGRWRYRVAVRPIEADEPSTATKAAAEEAGAPVAGPTLEGRARQVAALLEAHDHGLATREVREALGCGTSERARSQLRRALSFAQDRGWVAKRRVGRDNRWTLTDPSWRGAR